MVRLYRITIAIRGHDIQYTNEHNQSITFRTSVQLAVAAAGFAPPAAFVSSTVLSIDSTLSNFQSVLHKGQVWRVLHQRLMQSK